MFKFIKQYTETLTGAAVYPVFSLLVFFIFFVVLLVHVQRMSKSHVKDVSAIPLEGNNNNDQAA